MSTPDTATDAVVHADDTDFEAQLHDPRTVIAYFWAEWCPPCRMLGPVMQQLAAEHPETLKVIKINSDLSPRTSAAHQILAVPTLKVFVGTEPVRTIVGAKPKAALEFELARYLAR
ncbi:thioredoxin family protein [Microbacterium sp. STN6]|uniref:thioredoxin family protein n=1 Tax=Microbacterium sp. STN6 TaxID=2995588 RepID=UPI0022609D08|nr:thioredoxin family protein [Microbacterium sp. STN6]MCX7523143.1 thioredoxin family protein [Microbacterium sp. STN6]